MGFRISVDTGGTFTDVVVADEAGTLHLAKAPTDLERAFQSIEDGLEQLAPELGVTVGELLARHRRVHLRHDPGDERDRRGPHGPDRVLHHRGLPGHPPAPRGREARAFPAAPLPAPVRAPLPDVRDPRAHRLRGRRLRRARRGERPHRDRERAAPGRGGSRGVPDLGDRQPGRTSSASASCSPASGRRCRSRSRTS